MAATRPRPWADENDQHRDTNDPVSTWARRPVEWRGASWRAIAAGLPTATHRPIENGHGQVHRLEADISLSWPAGGIFTNAARERWNATSIGSGCGLARPLQPRQIAQALQETVRQSRLPRPTSWEAGMSELGEWWCLRACWPGACALRAGERESGERWVLVEHNVRWGVLSVASGLRQADGAVIVATHEGARLSGTLLTGERPSATLIRGVWREIDKLQATLLAWRSQRPSMQQLATWASRSIGRRWGAETRAWLLMRNGATQGIDAGHISWPAGQRETVDDLEQIAWTLAIAVLGTEEIDARRALAGDIIKMVERLQALIPGENDDEAPPAAPTYDALVH